MKISTDKNGRAWMTVNGKRCRVFISKGPWVSGVNPDLIKVRPKSRYFPDEFESALKIENNSDMMTDYFESDSLRLLPGHPLYEMASAA